MHASTNLNLTPTFALLRPGIDAHTLGVSTFAQLIEDCGWKVLIAGPAICTALNNLENTQNTKIVLDWLVSNRVVSVGYSYRLDSSEGIRHFGKFFQFLRQEKLHITTNGLIQQVLFAGLPKTCELIAQEYGSLVSVFWGDETAQETPEMVAAIDEGLSSLATEGGVPLEEARRHLRQWTTKF